MQVSVFLDKKNRGLSSIILEYDCVNVINRLDYSLLDLSYVGVLISYCLSITRSLGNILVLYVCRSVYHVAHALSRAMGSQYGLGIWDVNPPACIGGIHHSFALFLSVFVVKKNSLSYVRRIIYI